MVETEASRIRLENLSRCYDGSSTVRALCDINLDINRGERVAVMGPSGSGKSTMLNLICGIDEPSSGSVWIGGVDLGRLSDDERTRLRREEIGMIFQTFNLLATLSAVENVALPLRLQGKRRAEAQRRAHQMLEQVGLADRATNKPDEMSGGERQRIAIARALIFKPSVLLADEPTGNLDSTTGEEVLNLLDSLHSQFNNTVLLVTHNPLAAAHCERLVTLRDGKVISDGPLVRAEAEVL